MFDTWSVNGLDSTFGRNEMAHKRLSETYFMTATASVMGVVLALFAEPGRYLDSPGLLVILCAAVGFASARCGDENAFDKYTIAASIVGAAIGGLVGYVTIWWARGVVAEGRTIVWVLFLPAVFGLTSVVSHFVGSLNSGLRAEDGSKKPSSRPEVHTEKPTPTMTWLEAYSRYFAGGNAADWNDMQHALGLIRHESLVILRLDRQNQIWAFRLFRTPDEPGQIWDTAYNKVNPRDTIPSVYRIVVVD